MTALSLEQPLTEQEQEQLRQTIEMFEVITQANPQDCQSLDILKDAYQRVGKQQDALTIARRLADTYVELGQYSAAMLEYEGILQKDADNAEVMAALGEVEAFLLQHPQIPAYLVDVRAQRSMSQQIAARSGIEHESPQIIVFRRGVVVWSASHDDITAEALARCLPAA